MATIKDIDAEENGLKRLILTASPVNDHGNKTIGTVAKLIGASRYSVHKWIDAQHLSPRWAKKIADISEGRVSIEDFVPYLLNVPE